MLGVRRTVFEAAGAEFVANKHQLGHKHAHRTAAFTPLQFSIAPREVQVHGFRCHGQLPTNLRVAQVGPCLVAMEGKQVQWCKVAEQRVNS